MSERATWRRYFDILLLDEQAGIETTVEERRDLMGMVTRGENVFWRCSAGTVTLPVVMRGMTIFAADCSFATVPNYTISCLAPADQREVTATDRG